MKPLWECPDCGATKRSEPVASDDRGGEPVGIGPDCDECESPMAYVREAAEAAGEENGNA